MVKVYGNSDGYRTVELTPIADVDDDNVIIYDEYDLRERFGLILKERPYISPPEPKYRYIDIDGADGSLDYTELITNLVNYKMRTIKMTFLLANFDTQWDKVYAELLEFVQGRKFRIDIRPRPAGYYGYWRGRVTVDEWSSDADIGTIVLTATVGPYRTADFVTTTSRMYVSGGTANEWTITGGSMPVVPTLVVTSVSSSYGLTIQIKSGPFKTARAYDLTNGTYKLPFVMLGSGENVVELSGQGGVVMKYTQGWL